MNGFRILWFFFWLLLLVNCNRVSTTKRADSVNSIRIYLSDFEVNLKLNHCPLDTVIQLDSTYLHLALSDCRGASRFELKDVHNNLLQVGQYANGVDTLKKYESGVNAVTGDRRIRVVKYFEPLPEGTWYYYRNGTLVDSEVYKYFILH